MENEVKKLSASRIKTLKACSWTYWCKYHLKLPDKSNSGAERGNICHLVFEHLLDKSHKQKFNDIVKKNSIKGCPVVDRYVKTLIKKSKILNPNFDKEYESIDEMILVGLKHDFFCKGLKLFDPEYEFNLVNDNPKYVARGFIDKWGINEKKKTIYIKDYKSSRDKFCGDELESNIQAMLYSLFAQKTYPEYRCIVEFIFLKFGNCPSQTVEFNSVVLEGFEYYLQVLNEKVNNFSYSDALAELAANKPYPSEGFSGKLLCGYASKPGELKKDGTPKWHCPFKFAFDYYAIIKPDGSFSSSHLTKAEALEVLKEGEKLEERRYSGCPAFNKSSLTGF